MGLADLPDGFVTFTRDELIQKYLRDYQLRNPAADITSGQPVLDAKLIADQTLPIYSDASLIADGINEDDAAGPRLDRAGERVGLPRGKATGSTGYVRVTTSAGGGTIVVGTEAENPQTRIRYEAAETKSVDEGETIRLRAKTTGPNTDVKPDVALRWISPPPGVGTICTVTEQSGGRGLTGGADVEGDGAYLARIRERKRNPAAADNDAELVAAIRETPDVAIEQVFTWPGFYGPGSTAFTFTVLATTLGDTRVPATSQLQAAHDWIVASMPGDHSYFPLEITVIPVDVKLEVEWAADAEGWQDFTPWPASQLATVTAVTSATVFTVQLAGATPVIGQTFGVWDSDEKLFRRKQILSFTGTGPWVITCDTTNGASDTSYTPVIGQLVSPWSESLETITEAVLTYMASLGPGELFTFGTDSPTEGRRRHRTPTPPKLWPYRISGKLDAAVEAVETVAESSADASPDTVSPSIPPSMLELGDLGVYPP